MPMPLIAPLSAAEIFSPIFGDHFIKKKLTTEYDGPELFVCYLRNDSIHSKTEVIFGISESN